MHASHRSSSGSGGAEGDLLRQVLTRNLLAVTCDPFDDTEHLSSEPVSIPSRASRHLTRHDIGSNNSYDSTQHLADKDQNEDEKYTSSFAHSRSRAAATENTLLACGGEQVYEPVTSVDWSPSSSPKTIATDALQLHPESSIRHSEGRPSFLSLSDFGQNVCESCEREQSPVYRFNSGCGCSLSVESIYSDVNTRECTPDNEVSYNDSKFYASTEDNYCPGRSFPTRPRGEESDGLQPSFPRTRRVSSSTAFPFPSPSKLVQSDTRSSSGSCCCTEPFVDTINTRGSPRFLHSCCDKSDAFSRGDQPHDGAEGIASSSTTEILSGKLMPPPQELLPRPLQHRKHSLEVPLGTNDAAPLDSTCTYRTLGTRRESGWRRSSELRVNSDSGARRGIRSVSPKLVRRSDLNFGAVIGKGAFGSVYKGHLHERPVAIKVVQKRRGSGIHRAILQAERLAYSLRLRHDNIVHILGVNVCDDLRGEALIVMELVSSRTLQALLDDSNTVISPGERLRFGIELTAALSYLHSHLLVHLDVKPRNVLVGEDTRCKLADFGNLTRTKPGMPREDTDYTQLLGTLPYRAPELMKGQYPSCKADIYSLGITLWQLASRETPHSGVNPHWLIYQVIKANKRPDSHDTGNDALEIRYRELYQACWDAQPVWRPEADEAQKELAELREGLWECGWQGISEPCSRTA